MPSMTLKSVTKWTEAAPSLSDRHFSQSRPSSCKKEPNLFKLFMSASLVLLVPSSKFQNF